MSNDTITQLFKEHHWTLVSDTPLNGIPVAPVMQITNKSTFIQFTL